MSKIAIIDDAIKEDFLTNKIVKERIVIYDDKPDGKEIQTINHYTHATICAIVLEYCTENYELISVQIMKDCNTPANIDSLVRALEVCLDLKVDIISMSVGTVRLSESLKLNRIIQELANRKVIMVAAGSNQQLITLPASYPEVIGVQSDINSFLKPLEIAVHSKWWLGLQVTANCDLDFFKKFFIDSTSNSFAVPVVVSYINSYINKNKNPSIETVLKYLDKISSKEVVIELDKKVLESSKIKIPHVCMVIQEFKDFELGKEIINYLYNNYNIECVGFTKNRSMEDIRFLNIKKCGLEAEIIEIMIEKFCEAELIFSILLKKDFINLSSKFNIDLVISLNVEQTVFEVDGRKYAFLIGEESRNAGYIGDLIIEILS
ncbi:S8 family serine peptidase [Anaerosacchariphilus polymeriproducens]|uniref:Peptidase S8/S53 domain-containing protein n=1 Tax=Anaerosacchariphilus polymeriproducens TaxID=1812858 RepID=A0A371ASD7_9FIRM|nr:S8 family serine peptidase [Anaerosacchariphilus polymeriproducens]RDU22488.1 hypothetical protein DWV06_14460 [Anaerosacchariphilus polymeriproducens]